MNLIIHLVRKDAILWGWTIALWAAFGACALVLEKAKLSADSPYLPLLIFSLTVLALLALVLIAWIIQEDSPCEATAFWRSRPVPPMTMLAAKILLLVGLFVVIPTLGVFVGSGISAGFSDGFPKATGFLLCVVTASAALAACTRNVGEYILTGTIAAFLIISLEAFLEISWYGRERTAFILVSSKIWVSTVLCGVFGLSILLVQYRLRRTFLSYGLIAILVISLALVRAFWSWRFV